MLKIYEKNLRFIRNDMEAVNDSVNAIRNAIPATGGIARMIGSVALLVIGIVVIYYIYVYLYQGQVSNSQAIITSAIPANPTSSPSPYNVLPVYEGGEYTITFWTYITAFKDQIGKSKHILELSPTTTTGSPTSTLVVGLGAFNNKLMVRVNTNATGQQQLTSANVQSMFQPTQTPPGQLLADSMPICDLPEVDLQRWVCFGIVLNGRTVDVYMDGKLARSCVLPSFYTVDANGVRMKLLQYGGFNGFLSNVYVYGGALSPDQIYGIYMRGPADAADRGIWSWLGSLFDMKGEVTYTYPQVGVTYPRTTVTF